MKLLNFFFIAAAIPFLSFAQKTKSFEQHVPINTADKIEIRGFSGTEVDFKSWDKKDVYIKLEVHVESSNKDYEDDYIKSVDLVTNRSDGSTVITFKQPSMSGRSGFSWSNLFKLRFTSYNSIEVRGEVFVPQSNSLSLEARYSRVSLESMKGKLAVDGKSSTIRLKNCSDVHEIDNDYGTTSIEQSGGDLHLKSQSSKITVDTFDGPVDLDADYATIKLNEIKNSVVVASKSGTITAEHIGANLTVDADYSKVKIEDVRGFVDLQNQSGTVKVKSVEGVRVSAQYTDIEISSVSGKSARPIKIKGQSGRIDLESIVGDVLIDCPYSPISLRKVKGNVHIETTSGKIDLDDLTGNLTAKTEYTTFEIDNVLADTVVLSNKSNSISLSLKKSPARIDIRNAYGNVTLSLPANYSGDVNLKVAYGKIRSDFPISVEDVGSGAYFVGKLGNDRKSSMRIETSSGNIDLKSNSARD